MLIFSSPPTSALEVGGLRVIGTVGEYGEIKDFNLCTKTGYYIISGGDSAINNPGIGYGSILSIYSGGGGYSVQLAFDMFNKKIACRMTNSADKWEGWHVFN